jgi:hypothetical protein
MNTKRRMEYEQKSGRKEIIDPVGRVLSCTVAAANFAMEPEPLLKR